MAANTAPSRATTLFGRYSSFEFFRGQEGDPWKGHVADPTIPDALGGQRVLKAELWRQDWINRSYLTDEADHPQTLTFDAGMHFIDTNHSEDSWFLQIETFDPHEPFFSYAAHKRHYTDDYDGPHFDWPDYARVTEGHEVVDHARNEYAALVSMCDHSLGRVLDAMDEHNMWDDTMLIVCTDHGFLLGEHGWWGKNIQPWFDETIHTSLFIRDPRSRIAGEHRHGLVQTVDFAPTLLDFFGVPETPDMQGKPLGEVVADDTRVRETALFGSFGGHICVGDGRYVYMRASVDVCNQPLTEHTLMPTAMRSFPSLDALSAAELHPGFTFTKNIPLLRYPGQARLGPFTFGTLLFDLLTDPEQTTPPIDDDIELRMAPHACEIS